MIDYLGISYDQVLAVGDSFNDLSIFYFAFTSVAMGNSPESLKELADWIAPPVDEDGVAAVIKKFIL